MVSGIFILDFDQTFFDFDRKMLPIYSSTFGQMGMDIDEVRTPARTIPRISQLEIHSVYQAVIGTGFTWQCGGIAQLVELLI